MKGNRIAKVTEQSKARASDPSVHIPGSFPLHHVTCALYTDWRWFQFSLLSLFQSMFSPWEEFIERVCSPQCKSIHPGTMSPCTPHSSHSGSPPWTSISDSTDKVRLSAPSHVGAQLEFLQPGVQHPTLGGLFNDVISVFGGPIIAVYPKKNSSQHRNGFI